MLFGAPGEEGWVKSMKIHSSLNSNLLIWKKFSSNYTLFFMRKSLFVHKSVFDRAADMNNENLIKLDIRIHVVKHFVLLKLGLTINFLNNVWIIERENAKGLKKMFEIWRGSSYRGSNNGKWLMKVSYGIFTVPNKSFELKRCSNYRKSNYRESTASTCQQTLNGYNRK